MPEIPKRRGRQERTSTGNTGTKSQITSLLSSDVNATSSIQSDDLELSSKADSVERRFSTVPDSKDILENGPTDNSFSVISSQSKQRRSRSKRMQDTIQAQLSNRLITIASQMIDNLE